MLSMLMGYFVIDLCCNLIIVLTCDSDWVHLQISIFLYLLFLSVQNHLLPPIAIGRLRERLLVFPVFVISIYSCLLPTIFFAYFFIRVLFFPTIRAFVFKKRILGYYSNLINAINQSLYQPYQL